MSKAKLNQIIAVEKGIKSDTFSRLSTINKVVQKQELFNGFDKKYDPKDEDGDTLPAESKRVQYSANEVLKDVERSMSALMKITARKDWTNCQAKADVVVDGNTLIKDAPITYLLFLEKQITDLKTLVANMPVIDLGEKWELDGKSGLYKSEEIKRQRTSKEQTPIVLYDATPEHPAQTQIITKDVVVGYWKETKHSGSMALSEKKKLFAKIENLLQSIKEAREEANTIHEVDSPDVGEAIFGYLLPETQEGS